MENNNNSKLHIITVEKYPMFIESIKVLNKEELFDYCKENGLPIFKTEIKGYGIIEKTIYFLKLDDSWLYYEELSIKPS